MTNLKLETSQLFVKTGIKPATCFSSHRTENGQFSFQSQRKAMPKNVQTIAQLQSSHTLTK